MTTDESVIQPVKFVLRWEVGDVSKLTDVNRHSPDEQHSDMPWSIAVRKMTANAVEHLSMFIFCNDDGVYDFWSCEHVSTLHIINRNDEAASIKQEITTKFSHDHTNWGKTEATLFAELVDTQKGFILDDKILVEARVTVNLVNGIKKEVQFDFAKEEKGTIALNVAGEKVYVTKGFLATESPFFADLFYNEENEENQSEIELRDVSVKDFTELLLATYPSNKAVTATTYKTILDLAERFKVQRAKDEAELYLIKTKKLTVSVKLVLAEQYKLELLQLHCIHSLATTEATKALRTTDEYKKFSADLKTALYERMCDLIKA